jgi:hypothetical protein
MEVKYSWNQSIPPPDTCWDPSQLHRCGTLEDVLSNKHEAPVELVEPVTQQETSQHDVSQLLLGEANISSSIWGIRPYCHSQYNTCQN